MDWTPVLHALIAVLAQVLFGMVLGNWWLGGALACSWWLAREHTQAEYRWIAAFAAGHRATMPWWGGFDPRAWSMGSLLDAVLPMTACIAVFWAVS